MDRLSSKDRLQSLYRRVRVGGVLAASALLVSGCDQEYIPDCGTTIEDKEGTSTRSFTDLNGERVRVVYESRYAENEEDRPRSVQLRGYGDYMEPLRIEDLPQQVVLSGNDLHSFDVSFVESRVVVECTSTLDS